MKLLISLLGVDMQVIYLFDPLQELLNQCENRAVLFNNRTTDRTKKDEQIQELISLVNLVVAKSGGKPYTDELFVEMKVTFHAGALIYCYVKGDYNTDCSCRKELGCFIIRQKSLSRRMRKNLLSD